MEHDRRVLSENEKTFVILHLQSLQWPSHDLFFSVLFPFVLMRISRKADITLCNECMFLRGSWKRRRRYGEINAKCQRWPTSASSRTSNGFVTGNLCGRYRIAQSMQARESHLYTRYTVLYRLFIDHKISKSFEITYCGGDSWVNVVSIYKLISQSLFFSHLDFVPQLWFDMLFDDFRDWSRDSVVTIWDFKEKNIGLNSYRIGEKCELNVI